MGIFDIFTTTNAQDAANAQIAGLNSGYSAASGSLGQATSDLTNYLGQGNKALTTYYTQALQPYLTNYGQATSGTTALADALGLNGATGNAAATSAFWNNPATQSSIDIGSENVLRNAARTGSTNSGGTNADLQTLAQDVASQNWNSYVSSLQPYLNYSNSSAAGIANVDTGLGSSLNQNYTNLGTGTSSIDQLLANLGYTTQTGIGNANANADLAGNAASANFWSLATALANTGVNAAKTASGVPSTGGSSGGVNFNLLSDIRAKEDIEPVGELYDGTNIYKYRYKGDPVERIGVMAQEVEQTNPDAVTEVDGWKTVDYGKVGRYAAAFAPFREAA